MGIQREPGQKGFSWSNIAVGERISPAKISATNACEGGIMNMVISFHYKNSYGSTYRSTLLFCPCHLVCKAIFLHQWIYER